MGLIDQLVLLAFLGLGAALWMEAAHAMREAHGSLARSARRMDYAEAALKELQRETSSLRRLQKQLAERWLHLQGGTSVTDKLVCQEEKAARPIVGF